MPTVENTLITSRSLIEREDTEKLVSSFAEELHKLETEIDSFSPQQHLMPNVFGKAQDEDFISDWLAYILAPTVNSIGVKPLNILLELAKFDELLDEEKDVILSEKPGQYHVIREKWLSDEDRIDFLIKVKRSDSTLVIAIENKVFSGLSKSNQLVSYTNHLNKLYNKSNHSEVVMIFLARQATIKDIKPKKLGDFRPVTHERLTEKLKNLASQSFNDQRATFLVQEYVYNMEQNILDKGNNMNNLSDKMTEFLCSGNKRLEKIMEIRDELYQEIREEVYTRVAECFDDSYKCSGFEVNDGVDSNDKVKGDKYYCYWHKKKHPWFLHYEIEFKRDMFDEDGNVQVSVCLHYEGNKSDGKADNLRKNIKLNMTVILCQDLAQIKMGDFSR